ncbi:hypothetical protein ACFX12_046997 [Malus domestica]
MSSHNRGVHDKAQWWCICHWTRCKWRDMVLYRGGGTCQDVGAFGNVRALPYCGASDDVLFDDGGASCAVPFAGGAPSCFGSSGFVLFNGDTLPSFGALGADEFDGDASPYFGASGAVPFDGGVSPCFGALGAVAFDDVEVLPSFGISGVGLLDGAWTGAAYRALPGVKKGEGDLMVVKEKGKEIKMVLRLMDEEGKEKKMVLTKKVNHLSLNEQ